MMYEIVTAIFYGKFFNVILIQNPVFVRVLYIC